MIREKLIEPHHRERVELAIGKKLVFDFCYSVRWRGGSDGFHECRDGHAAVLDSI